jgi:hypothetical protein
MREVDWGPACECPVCGPARSEFPTFEDQVVGALRQYRSYSVPLDPDPAEPAAADAEFVTGVAEWLHKHLELRDVETEVLAGMAELMSIPEAYGLLRMTGGRA